MYNLQGFVKFGEFSKGNFFFFFLLFFLILFFNFTILYWFCHKSTWILYMILTSKITFPLHLFFYQRAVEITKFICIFLEQSMHPQLSIHILYLLFTQMMSYYTHCVLQLAFCPCNRSWSSFHNSTCRADSFFHLVFVCLWVYCITLFGCGSIYWTSKVDFNLLF